MLYLKRAKRFLMVLVCLSILLGSVHVFSKSYYDLAIGAKNCTEQNILSEIMAQLLEDRGYRVKRNFYMDNTLIAFEALRSGEIDLYPEYTGTALLAIIGDNSLLKSANLFEKVKTYFHQKYHLEWLAPFGFHNQYSLVMKTELAEKLGIQKISDLKNHAITAGFDPEFLSRLDYKSLKETYGLALREIQMEHPIAEICLEQNEIDLMNGDSTEGIISRHQVKILEDDLRALPCYEASPIIREKTLQKHPEIEAILGELAGIFDDETMRQLNYRVEEKEKTLYHVARDFLHRKALLKNI